jgi:Ca2+-binding RTX toxin-like protein
MTLPDNVEVLQFTGTAALNGTGNALGNRFYGNDGANVLTGLGGDDLLNGGLGADTMVGGVGNDSYYVDQLGDVTMENAGEGADTVYSSLTWTLANNLESVVLTGTAAIDGTGNTGDNYLTGNTAANVLNGGDGNDTINGTAGNDVLIGGRGADAYRFGAGYGVDTIQENDGTTGVKDNIQFTGTVKQADVTFKHVGNNLEMLLNGTTDKLVVQDWYLGTSYHVEEFRFADGTLLDTAAQGLASMMATFDSGSGAMATSGDLTRQSHDRVQLPSLLASSML